MYQFSSINFQKCDNYGHSIKFVKEVYDNFFAPLYIVEGKLNRMQKAIYPLNSVWALFFESVA